MRLRAVLPVLLVALLLGGCWDKLEVEDQLFPVVMAVDTGQRKAYNVTLRMPVAAAMRAGILGGRTTGHEPVETMSVEADNLAQALYILNASVTRRMTFRHLRGLVVGEDLARRGMDHLMEEVTRSAEIHETVGFWVAPGKAGDVLKQAKPTAEMNPGKVNEGLLLVEKGLHMAPPIRLQHMIMRRIIVGQDPFAPVMGSNRRIIGGDTGQAATGSAIAGDLDRSGTNPLEIAGTAVFRDTILAGFLNVDETQALLALRGEMGKAYVTLPDPLQAGSQMMIRFQQENKPQYRASLTQAGPRVSVRILLEGELLTGMADFRKETDRRQVEDAANAYMQALMKSVLQKQTEWRADPVGFGVLFRNRFAIWSEWNRWNWRLQIPKLQVTVTTDMRIRRSGMNHRLPFERGPWD